MTQDLNALTEAEFRIVVRKFLADNYPENLRNPPKRLHWRDNQVW